MTIIAPILGKITVLRSLDSKKLQALSYVSLIVEILLERDNISLYPLENKCPNEPKR